REVIAIAVGNRETCAIRSDRRLKCWGVNFEGELGLGDRNARGDGQGEMGDNLPVVDLGTGRTVVSVVTGYVQSCALLDNSTVKCWGGNFFGSLGLGAGNDRGDEPNEMGDDLPAIDLGAGRRAIAISIGGLHTCALLDTGTVKCWGESDVGE